MRVDRSNHSWLREMQRAHFVRSGGKQAPGGPIADRSVPKVRRTLFFSQHRSKLASQSNHFRVRFPFSRHGFPIQFRQALRKQYTEHDPTIYQLVPCGHPTISDAACRTSGAPKASKYIIEQANRRQKTDIERRSQRATERHP